jgi:Flp pilus assembly protein TadG
MRIFDRASFSRRRSRRRRSQSGQAMVELTLLSPVLFLLALGVADFGRVFYRTIAVNNAARAGAQYAVREKYTDLAGIQNAAVQDANLTGFTGSGVTSSYYCQCPGTTGHLVCVASLTCAGGAPPELYVRVDTSFTFTTLVNYPGVPHSTTLAGRAILRAR